MRMGSLVTHKNCFITASNDCGSNSYTPPPRSSKKSKIRQFWRVKSTKISNDRSLWEFIS